MHHTNEPPIPRPEHYGRSYDAARRTRWGRARRALSWIDRHPGWIAAGVVVAVAALPVYVIAQENRAIATADRAAVVSKPTATPGVPARARGPEYSPPAATSMGDGTWLLGREVKRGLYAAPGGSSCYWERLSDLSGDPDSTIDVGFARRGPQKVALGKGDFAFVSQGCGTWVMVR